MKLLILAAATILFSTQVFAQTPDYEPTICESLTEQADQNCQDAIIEDCKANGFSAEECVEDGDYAVVHQECTGYELEELIAGHNAANSKKQPITCEDY